MANSTVSEVKPTDALDNAFNQAQELCLRVDRLVNRLISAAPKPTRDGSDESPDGDLNRLIDKASTTISYIADANASLDRLEKII